MIILIFCIFNKIRSEETKIKQSLIVKQDNAYYHQFLVDASDFD